MSGNVANMRAAARCSERLAGWQQAMHRSILPMLLFLTIGWATAGNADDNRRDSDRYRQQRDYRQDYSGQIRRYDNSDYNRRYQDFRDYQEYQKFREFQRYQQLQRDYYERHDAGGYRNKGYSSRHRDYRDNNRRYGSGALGRSREFDRSIERKRREIRRSLGPQD